MKLFPKQWKKVAEIVQTRTTVQVRTHAQKWELNRRQGKEMGTVNQSSPRKLGAGSPSKKKSPSSKQKSPSSAQAKNCAVDQQPQKQAQLPTAKTLEEQARSLIRINQVLQPTLSGAAHQDCGGLQLFTSPQKQGLEAEKQEEPKESPPQPPQSLQAPQHVVQQPRQELPPQQPPLIGPSGREKRKRTNQRLQTRRKTRLVI